jgi:hypothetical protein
MRIYLTTLLILFLISCSNNDNAEQSKGEQISNNEVENPIKEATESSESDAEVIGKWMIDNMIDEFGDTTGKKNIYALFKGEMSNSATNSADLLVRIDLVDGKFFARFLEYGSQKANLPDEKFVTVKAKTESGEVLKIRHFTYQNMLYDSEGELMELVRQHGSLKLLLDFGLMSKYDQTKYIYTIGSDGLEEVLSELN